MYKGIIKFPKVFWNIAEEIGMSRNTLNKDNNEKNPRFKRGNKENQVDTIGVIGELIARHFLTNNNQEFKASRLLDLYPEKNADIIIENKRIDVKTKPITLFTDLLVNKEAHEKGHNVIDLYWFICLVDENTAEHYVVNYDDVSKWKYKKLKYTEAHYMDKNKLKATTTATP